VSERTFGSGVPCAALPWYAPWTWVVGWMVEFDPGGTCVVDTLPAEGRPEVGSGWTLGVWPDAGGGPNCAC